MKNTIYTPCRVKWIEDIRVKRQMLRRLKKLPCPRKECSERCARMPRNLKLETLNELYQIALRFGICTACWKVSPEHRAASETWMDWCQDGRRTRYAVPRAQARWLERRSEAQFAEHGEMLNRQKEVCEELGQLRWETAGAEHRLVAPLTLRFLERVDGSRDLQALFQKQHKSAAETETPK